MIKKLHPIENILNNEGISIQKIYVKGAISEKLMDALNII